jgi:Pyruvate/2-oxoacid:ferredoxin oxidoreductase delta subunit
MMELDANGKPHPTGQFETLNADAIILALGQETDSGFLQQVPAITFAADGAVIVGSDMMTGHAGVFAGGDMVPGAQSVTISVGQGKRAARNIDGWLRQKQYVPAQKHALIGFADLHLPIYSDALPSHQAEIPAAFREGFAEVTAGLNAAAALHEAKRCLSCGNCFECDNCFAACPEVAIVKLAPTQGYRVDMTLCTGCAVCVEQCPCHAMEMVPETALAHAQGAV